MASLLRCALCLFLTAAALAAAESNCLPNAPCYTAAGAVNAASSAQNLAPFTWVSLYGNALSYNTVKRSAPDGSVSLGGVGVLINGRPAYVDFVSPSQVNFLLPYEMETNTISVQLAREGVFGPAILAGIKTEAPELFLLKPGYAVAANPTNSAKWTVVTETEPAHPGDIVILYATGLGATQLPLDDQGIPALKANPIQRRSEFILTLDGQQVEDRLIEYAGAAPLLTGDYQINLRLPAHMGNDPEIRIGLGTHMSAAGTKLYVRPAETNATNSARGAFQRRKGLE